MMLHEGGEMTLEEALVELELYRNLSKGLEEQLGHQDLVIKGLKWDRQQNSETIRDLRVVSTYMRERMRYLVADDLPADLRKVLQSIIDKTEGGKLK